MTSFQDRLRAKVERCVERREKPFTLKSGAQSHVYCDLRPLLLSYAWRTELCAVLERVMPNDTHVIGGPVLGAAILVPAINTRRVLGTKPMLAEFLTRPPKEHGKAIEKLMSIDFEPAGKRIVIVEDVVTTGGSAAQTAAVAQHLGMQVAAVLAVVNRSGSDTFPLPNPDNFGNPEPFSSFYPIFELDETTGAVSWNERTLRRI